MNEKLANKVIEYNLKSSDFIKISELVYNICGIQLPLSKQVLVEGRIKKRIKSLNMENFSEYSDYLFSTQGFSEELHHLIDAITTNKTDFFREPGHFEFLKSNVLPEILAKGNTSHIKIWSAGCSTGEEPYTLGIVLSEYFQNSNVSFNIYASDISLQVLEKAKNAIYDYDVVDVIPLELKKKYLLKSTNENKKLVKICAELRETVEFKRINFMDDEYDIPENMDVVFCRNVIIYFDKPTQHKVLSKIARKIKKGGYLFIGHSETLMNMDLPLKRMASTIYMKV